MEHTYSRTDAQGSARGDSVEPVLLSKKQAAAAIGVSVRLLEKLITDGDIAVRRIHRRVLVPKLELLRFANKTCRAGASNCSSIRPQNL